MNRERSEEKARLLRLAELLRYPDHGLQRAVDDSEEVVAFFEEVAVVDPRGLEELYTTTFDLNPVATLEVGWHLWGEQYERGRFLADLRGIQERIGITEATELPDHLTLLLPTIAATDDEGLRDKCAMALEKILKPLEEHGNPYRHLLRAVRDICRPPCHPERSEGSVWLGGAQHVHGQGVGGAQDVQGEGLGGAQHVPAGGAA